MLSSVMVYVRHGSTEGVQVFQNVRLPALLSQTNHSITLCVEWIIMQNKINSLKSEISPLKQLLESVMKLVKNPPSPSKGTMPHLLATTPMITPSASAPSSQDPNPSRVMSSIDSARNSRQDRKLLYTVSLKTQKVLQGSKWSPQGFYNPLLYWWILIPTVN